MPKVLAFSWPATTTAGDSLGCFPPSQWQSLVSTSYVFIYQKVSADENCEIRDI